MHGIRRINVALALLLACVLSLAVLGCVEPTVPGDEGLEKPEPFAPPETFFVRNEFIVTGPDPGTVQAVVERAMLEVRKVYPENELPDPELAADPVDLHLLGQVMVLYAFDEEVVGTEIVEQVVADVVVQVNRIAEEPAEYGFDDFDRGFVAADLNYLARLAQAPTPTPTPPPVVAGPWEPQGSPHGGNGGKNASVADFRKQWAFAQIQLSPAVTNTFTGAGVAVGVFDTSPCRSLGDPVCQGLPFPLASVTDFVAPPLSGPGGPLVTDHGLFVAGLFNYLAPAAEIHVYRVLNDHGTGTLFWLIAAIKSFADRLPEKAVINLSLGIRLPDEPANLALPADVPLLRAILQAAHDKGAVIVAAAGNESAGVTPPKGMLIPASYGFVVGVAGTNFARGPACFSNLGDIAAPGGDGFTGGPFGGFPQGCQPRNNQCASQGGPPGTGKDRCLVSVSPTTSSGPIHSRYAFWTGTSFATPLVSGLAALALEKGVAPADVPAEIDAGACPSTDPSFPKIINLPRTLLGTSSCPP